MQLIDEAVQQGACRSRACEQLGVSVRSVQRWQHTPQDGRIQADREAPPNKLSEAQRQAVLEAANRPGYASLTPHQIVPKLADEGVYLASESTFYRILKAAGQGQRRGRRRRRNDARSRHIVPMAQTRCGAGTLRGCRQPSGAGTFTGT
jgi:putative transposase